MHRDLLRMVLVFLWKILGEVHPTSPSHDLISHDHSSLEKDDEWETYLKCLKEMDKENNYGDPYLTDSGRVMIDTKEVPTSHMDKEEENTIVGSIDEDFSNFPIENKDTIEDQRQKKSIDDSDVQEPTLPPSDESTDLRAYVPFLSSYFQDIYCSDSEGDILVGSSSLEREHDFTETKSIGAFI
jgi:hypothetical protein